MDSAPVWKVLSIPLSIPLQGILRSSDFVLWAHHYVHTGRLTIDAAQPWCLVLGSVASYNKLKIEVMILIFLPHKIRPTLPINISRDAPSLFGYCVVNICIFYFSSQTIWIIQPDIVYTLHAK
jgi:hypothetical protein